jgi:hypothetical protein
MSGEQEDHDKMGEQPPRRLTGFSVYYRNPGHWDVNTFRGREFRIRGEGKSVMVSDERDASRSDPEARGWKYFKSVETALSWCADELRNEIETVWNGQPS